jgi:hypothetical protein
MISLRMELERLCNRFEIAVANFGRSCIDLRANEKAFQAWYAASVIQEFGMSRVYREIHCDNDYLRTLLPNDELLKENKMKHEFLPDLSVPWKPDVDARHTTARKKAGEDSKILQKLAIISELKVTGSTYDPTKPGDLRDDLEKLRIFAEAHRAEFKKLKLFADAQHAEAAQETQNTNGGLATYYIILDNHRSAFGRLERGENEARISKILSEAAAEWPKDSIKPKVIVIQPSKIGVNIQIYDQFKQIQ